MTHILFSIILVLAQSVSFPGPGSKAYSAGAVELFVRTAPYASAATNTIATSFSTLPTVGNTVRVFCGSNPGGVSFNTPTDNQSHTYTLLVVSEPVNSTRAGAGIWQTAVTASSGTFTVTCTTTREADLSVTSVTAAEYSGSSATADGTSTATWNYPTNSNTYTCGGVTTTNARDIVLAFFSFEGGDPNYSASAPFTQRITNATLTTSDNIVTSTGTYTPVFTTTGTSTLDGVCVVAAMRSAP